MLSRTPVGLNVGTKWDIRYNPVKSQLMTFGGSNPDKITVYLDRKVVQWCTKVKYLGLYLIGGTDFKIDLTAAKRKYYGCFITIRPMSVVGNQVNEIMALLLVKSYCLPQLVYVCEIWPLNSVNIHEIDIIWNNGVFNVFNAAGEKVLNSSSFIVELCRYLIL